jgi:hypothetical protein
VTVATGLAPDVVMAMDDQMLITIIDVIAERGKHGRR